MIMSQKWVLAILDGFGLENISIDNVNLKPMHQGGTEKIYQDQIFSSHNLQNPQNQSTGNSISLARTPVLDHLMQEYPHTYLQASEAYVGLPAGQMGNSEVGHITIGAGRIVRQGLSRIDHAIASGEFETHPLLHELCQVKRCHLMGLFSDGGVHSHMTHALFLMKILAQKGVEVFLHIFTDGRDTPPKSALTYVDILREHTHIYPNIHLSTIQGRFFAMDRDHRWERTKAAYDAIVHGVGEKASSFEEAVEQSYAKGIGDEFIPPYVMEGYTGMEAGDAILHVNFRADRVRQLLGALVDPQFSGFPRTSFKAPCLVVGMSDYGTALAPFVRPLYPNTPITDGLVNILSASDKKIFKIAETEKYAHVTFFFNGGVEENVAGEERVLIPSPHVKTYDETPKMSAEEVTSTLMQTIALETFDLLVVNYANPDMVGHTGVVPAILEAIEYVDTCIGKVWETCQQHGYNMMITADHGNAEHMMEEGDPTRPHTAHTCNPVPLILAGVDKEKMNVHPGTLADIAPTLLHFYKIPSPTTMTGTCLIS